MGLRGLAQALTLDSTFENISRAAHEPLASRISELSIGAVDGARPALLTTIAANVQSATNDQATTLVITATEREAEDLTAAFKSYVDPMSVLYFPAWETLPHERLSPRTDTVGSRLTVLRALTKPTTPSPAMVVAPVRAVLQPIVDGLQNMEPVVFTVGEETDFKTAVKSLASAAYSRVDLVTKRGEFAVRGGIIDVFAPTADTPARIEFFGDEIESIRWFSAADQRTLSNKEHPSELTALPCRELLITPEVMSKAARLQRDYPGAAAMLEKIAGGIYVEGMESLTPLLVEKMVTLIELLPAGSLPLVVEPERVRARSADLVATNEEFLYAAWDTVAEGSDAPIDLGQNTNGLAAGSFRTVTETRETALNLLGSWWETTSLGIDEDALDDNAVSFTFAARAPHTYAGNMGELLTEVKEKLSDGWRIVTVTNSSGAQTRLLDVLQEAGVPAARVDDLSEEPQSGIIEMTIAPAGKGFMLDGAKLGLLTEADILGRTSTYTTRTGTKAKPARRRKNRVDPMTLQPGDYVVHDQHGIGRFVELTQRPVAGATVAPGQPKPMKEYLVLEYASSKRGAPKDRLFVPTDQLDLVTNYVGGDAPTLSKMGGSDWAKTKSRARKAVKEIAADLIKLYSARQATRGHAFGPDTPWQQELEEAFPYNETPDQLTAIHEVKADMEKEIPMDRLISGDVGFGKTEIAIRAAFKAVQDGKQIAVLVPTTLLAQQHSETFTERYAGFPVRVAVLSRFQTKKQSLETIEGIKNGSIDIVIGTHRILSESIEFKDLGLVIIDEEQRFGVEHKEKLKTMRTNVDVLAMSATPIPRTLEMSLTGIRETSTLLTAPEERHPVLTYVGARTEKQLTAAIRRELMREGQVFFVHNRVASIEETANELQRLVPEARIATAHGRMSESRLEQIIVDFWERKFDVLVCTTIVETGLDISNANTLIVDQAQNYGLSQLHQLRGRVGRSRERAYAYFLYPPEKILNETALERLRALAMHSDLGSGLQLAMKDLEIRGAGNLLGGEQSGHIAGVGFDLYLRLVGEAVANFSQADEEETTKEIKIDLPVNAHIPHNYVGSERLRLAAYRDIAQAADAATLDEIREELVDRYGEIPEPVENLFRVAALRHFARTTQVTEITAMGPKIRFFPANDMPESRIMRLKRLYPGALHKQIPGTENWHLLIPKPKTAAVGGKDLVDGAVLDWTHDFLKAIYAETEAKN